MLTSRGQQPCTNRLYYILEFSEGDHSIFGQSNYRTATLSGNFIYSNTISNRTLTHKLKQHETECGVMVTVSEFIVETMGCQITAEPTGYRNYELLKQWTFTKSGLSV